MLRALALVVIVSVLTYSPASAQAMRCGTHLIQAGDTRIELIARCGEPTDVSRRVEEHVSGRRGGLRVAAQSTTQVVDSYIYNFGHARLMRLVEIREGIITRIDTLGLGFNPDAVAHADAPIYLGDTRIRVRSRWGAPADTSVSQETRAAGVDGTDVVHISRATVEVETWIFNFGPSRLMRRVIFRDGRVVRVETLRPGI
ncbi:MAG: DUF2845 domain-containing protein [Deltaproteobacteria bacterium]|nr:DUF2845 domain-containing protein [Deltaproteobacteria bacterium]